MNEKEKLLEEFKKKLREFKKKLLKGVQRKLLRRGSKVTEKEGFNSEVKVKGVTEVMSRRCYVTEVLCNRGVMLQIKNLSFL